MAFNETTFFALKPSPEACLITDRTNKTIFIKSYEGIPETLILNVIAWLILLLLFTILRQQAWDYGRLALVNSSSGINKRWTQVFYAHGSGETEMIDRCINQNVPIPDRGFLSWVVATFRLTKEQIMAHSGPDAVHYLSFQQHLMFVMGVMTVVSIVIILPVNFQGTLSGDVNSFSHTTIANLEADSNYLWVHIFAAITFIPLVVLVMRRSSGRNAGKTAPTRTIMATGVSPNDCNKSVIKTYLQQLFPDIGIEDLQLAYNVSELISVATEYERIVEARIFCEQHKNTAPIKATPNCFTCKTVDALEYYNNQEMQLAGDVARLRASALNDPLGIAFITVSSMQEAQHIIMHFKPGTYREWNLSYAPAPSDIFWENLNIDSARWYFKWIAVNLILFIFLFFLTTPVLIVNSLNTWALTNNHTSTIEQMSPLVSEFLPTLLLWILAALMPVIVAYSETWLSHWTRSKLNYAVMTKSFGYLLFMILILPSLGLTSAQAFLEWTISINNESSTYRWDCIFLPDKGAFFVNYVITAALIGTSLELIRFPELIVYLWKLCTAKSKAETSYIRKSVLIEFPFGIHYAWTVMVFTMSTVYSLACPLIMPFAMLYISLKHFGDRHNLFFVYGPSNMISQGGGKIHSTAVTMTKFSVIFLMIIMAALESVRSQEIGAKSIVLILALVITIVLFTFMSPIKRCTTKPPVINEIDGPAPMYVADVLVKSNSINTSPTHLSYGSDTTADIVLEGGDPGIRNITT